MNTRRPIAALLAMSLLMPGITLGQSETLRIGIIDFYGLRKISAGRLADVLGLKVGDPIPASTSEATEFQKRLERVRGVARARLERVCCDAGKAILYVGIEEKGGPHFETLSRGIKRPAVALPHEIVDTFELFEDALQVAVRAGDAADDVSQGHSLMTNPEVRAIQERFLVLAVDHAAVLRDVLRHAPDGQQRAIAAWVLGYAPNKNLVVDDLHQAIHDPFDEVRNNAVRSLSAIAVLANRRPELGIPISPAWFIDMLNSIAWTDRNKALFVLSTLTENNDQAVLLELRRRALPSLIEMARWQSAGHALPAYILLGRITGWTEDEIRNRWTTDPHRAVEDAVKSFGSSRENGITGRR